MLEMAGHVVPGLEKHVEFAELGTPLTNVHYCASTQGNLYGTEKSLLQIGPFAQPLATSIRGLWMCGASTLSHGVMGAHLSGLAVASRVVGCRMWDLVSSGGAPITLLPSEHPETWPKDRLRKPAEVATEEQASA
jgi:hypothetical protein